MVKAPPWNSAGWSLPARGGGGRGSGGRCRSQRQHAPASPARARVARSLTASLMPKRPSRSADLTMGVMRPPSVATATHTSTPAADPARTTPALASKKRLTSGTSTIALATALTTMSLTLTATPAALSCTGQ